jgi:hypothetical protein
MRVILFRMWTVAISQFPVAGTVNENNKIHIRWHGSETCSLIRIIYFHFEITAPFYKGVWKVAVR